MTAPATNALTSLVQTFLPAKYYGRAKSIVAGVLSVASAVLLILPYITGVPEQVGGIIGIVITVLTPVAVFLTGNEDAHQPEHEAAATALDGSAIPPAQD